MYRLLLLVVMAFIAMTIFWINIKNPTASQQIKRTSQTQSYIPTNTPSPTPYIFHVKKLYDLVQEWRIQNNLQPYIKSDFLCSIADIRLKETEKQWDHSQFIGSRFCTSECSLGENLSRFFKTEQGTIDAWIQSPDHLENLKRDFSHTCLKCDTTSISNYCVQIFGYY